MKVFISSVRLGLEEQRDALPGLIKAIGHEPLRFEDFTSKSVPSREACLAGVEQADTYVLLIGAHYGAVQGDSGFAPTHEEYELARRRGIPRLLFRKAGVPLDPDQAAFVETLERYDSGLFRSSFVSTADLLTKVAAALRDQPPTALVWRPLTTPVVVAWSTDWSERSRHSGTLASSSLVEVHVLPVPSDRVPRRRLATLPASMAERLRVTAQVAAADPLEPGGSDEAAWVVIPPSSRHGRRETDPGGLQGCRIASTGQRSGWARLPADSMGSVIDETDIARRVSGMLRMLGAIEPLSDGDYAIAVGLRCTQMTVLGSVSQLGNRTSVSGFLMNDVDVRLPPDEVVPRVALDAGADEVASDLARLLVAEFSRVRR